LRNANDSKRAELQPDFDDSAWEKADPQSDTGPLNEHEQAIFRTKIQMTADDLTAQAIQLKIGSIDDDGWVYVNGQFVGESHGNASSDFGIKQLLRAGENTIAVAVINRGGPGGLNSGVMLEIVKENPAPQWQRSAFNGLAQIIVQSVAEPGEIKLTASADGLTPTTALIQSK
jgi:hypothetical protein